jgi:hypothetical protein
MPFVLIDRIVIDSHRGTESYSAVSAVHKHYICPARGAGSPHRAKHVNVVIGARTRSVYAQEDLPCQTVRVDWFRCKSQAAAKIDLRALIERWRHISILCVARANAPKRVAKAGVDTADKKIAVRIHVERSKCGQVREINWKDPGCSAVGGPRKSP